MSFFTLVPASASAVFPATVWTKLSVDCSPIHRSTSQPPPSRGLSSSTTVSDIRMKPETG
jgi:hypothetical protein